MKDKMEITCSKSYLLTGLIPLALCLYLSQAFFVWGLERSSTNGWLLCIAALGPFGLAVVFGRSLILNWCRLPRITLFSDRLEVVDDGFARQIPLDRIRSFRSTGGTQYGTLKAFEVETLEGNRFALPILWAQPTPIVKRAVELSHGKITEERGLLQKEITRLILVSPSFLCFLLYLLLNWR